MRKPFRGLTLIEILVAMTLLVLLTALSSEFIINLFDLTARSGQRSKLQAEATVSLNQLTSDLQLTQVSRLSRADLPGGGVALGFPRLQEVTGQGALVWQEQYVVFRWDPVTGRLQRSLCPPCPSSLNISVDPANPRRLSSADLVAFSACPPNGTEHLLSDSLKAFIVTLSGPTVDVQLDLEVPGRKLEKLTVKSTLALRN